MYQNLGELTEEEQEMGNNEKLHPVAKISYWLQGKTLSIQAEEEQAEDAIMFVENIRKGKVQSVKRAQYSNATDLETYNDNCW